MCIFCKIVNKEIPSNIVLEDNNNEEPKYIVSYDPVKDDGDGSMNVSTLKLKV